jgi:Yqey-like protein
MTHADDDLRDRLRRALPAAMKAQDRPAMSALRSALAAIDNAEAFDPDEVSPDDLYEALEPAGWEPADTGASAVDAAHPRVAGHPGSRERSRVLVRRRWNGAASPRHRWRASSAPRSRLERRPRPSSNASATMSTPSDYAPR